MPYTTVYHTTTHPWVDFQVVDISTAVGIMPVPKWSALETSRRERSEDVPFGLGTLLVVERSTLENRPRGAVIYTVLYGS